jgi:N-acetylneuraminic acid mutarotase
MRRVWILTVALLAVVLLITGTALAASPHRTGSFTPATSMNTARGYFTATELLNGNILVAGGYGGAPGGAGPPSFFTAAEIYHQSTGTWSPVASMNAPRAAAVAVRLPGGKVLVAGGIGGPTSAGSAEIYDPATNTWTSTGSLNVARFEDMAASLLPGGRVLVAGGFVPSATGQPPFAPLASTEIWHPRTGHWTRGKSMHQARGEFASVKLKDGRILVMGGVDASGAALKSAEIYNPHTGHWSYTAAMHVARFDESAVVLHDGRVLVAGGGGASGQPITSSEIYNPRTKTWKTTGSLNVARSEAEYAIVRMPNNRVLIAGGYNTLGAAETDINTAEVYNPRTGTWTEVATTMSSARSGHAAVLLRGNRGVLVMGGAMGPATATTDIFHW